MADDNYIITITYSFDTGNVESEASAAGKRAGEAFGKSFQPHADWVNRIVNPGDFAKKVTSSFSDAFKNLNVSLELEKALDGVKFDRTEFGKNLEKTFSDAAHKGAQAITPPPQVAATTPAAVVSDAIAKERIASSVAPLVASLQGFTALMRGAPIASVAETILRPYFEQARTERERGRQGVGPSAMPVTGGTPRESDEERVDRRLAAAAAAGRGAGGPPPPPPPPTPPLIPPGFGGAAAGAAAGQLFGAPLGGAIGGFLGGARGGIAGIIIQKILEGLNEALPIKEMGERGAERVIGLKETAGLMGTSKQELLEIQQVAAHAGVSFESIIGILNRLALTAQQQLPRINREAKDSANVIEESNIKVRESHLAVEKAQDDRAASVDRLTKAAGELIKFDATRAQEREQQARAAGLAVTGAQIGLRGAEMQTAQAFLNQQFAPRQQRLEDIRGPLTVRGAELGERGAQISLEEEQARYNRKYYGEEEDPQEVELRERRKDELRLANARQKREEARAHTEETRFNEDKRLATRAAGLGPEAQAEQQLLQAVQAEQMARLRVDQAKTAQEGLKITQAVNTQEMERAELLRQINEALRNEITARQKTPEITADRARLAAEQLQYRLPELIGRGLEGGIPGFEPGRIEPQGLRDYFLGKTQGKILGPGSIFEELSKYLRETLGGEGGDEQKQIGAIRALLPGLRSFQMGGLEGFQGLRRLLLQSPEEREAFLNEPMSGGVPGQPVQTRRQYLESIEQRATAAEPGAFALQSQQAMEGFSGSLQRLTGEIDAIKPAAKISAFQDAITSGETGIRNALTGLTNAITNPSSLIDQAGRNLAENINKLSQMLSGITGAGPKPSPFGPGELTLEEAPGGQSGGLLHGGGTGTSDDIPIKASAGEFVVRASEVAKPGVLAHLEAINAGRYAEGGYVAPVSSTEAEQMRRLQMDPTNPEEVEVYRRVYARLYPKGKPSAGAGASGTGGVFGQIFRGEVFRGTPGPPAISYPPGADAPGVRGMTTRGFKDLPGYRPAPGSADYGGPGPITGTAKPDEKKSAPSTHTTTTTTIVIREPPKKEVPKQEPPDKKIVDGKPVPVEPPSVTPTPGRTEQTPTFRTVPDSTPAPTPTPGRMGPQLANPDARTRREIEQELRAGKQISPEQWDIWMKTVPGSKGGGWEEIMPPIYHPKGEKLPKGDYYMIPDGKGGFTYKGGRPEPLFPPNKYDYPGPNIRAPKEPYLGPHDERKALFPKSDYPDVDTSKPYMPGRGRRGELEDQEAPQTVAFKAAPPFDIFRAETEEEFNRRQLRKEMEPIPTEPEGEAIPIPEGTERYRHISHDEEYAAKGGLIASFVRRRFQSGGYVGGGIPPNYVPAVSSVLASLLAPGDSSGSSVGSIQAASFLSRQIDVGGLFNAIEQGVGGDAGAFSRSLQNVGGYRGGFPTFFSGGEGLSTLGFHQLDLRTDYGNIPAAVSASTLESLQQSALMGKMTATGQRPSWFS